MIEDVAAMQIASEHKHVIAKALERHKMRMEEVEALGWYKDSSVVQNEIARINAALAALEQQPQGKCMCGCDACKYCEQPLEASA